MRRRILTELTRPAMVVALLALAMASTGTAVATGLIGGSQIRTDAINARHIRAGSVHGEEIKNLSVGPRDLARASVNSTKIKNGSVRREDLASDAVSAEQIAAGAITSHALGEASVTPAAIADGAVAPRALDPQLARVYQMARRLDPGQPDALLTNRDGYRYSLRCTDDGGGQRTASLVISRPDGSSDWSIGGVRSYIAPAVGPITDWIGLAGSSEYILESDSTENAGAVIEIWVGKNSLDQGGQRVSVFLGNTGGGAPRCVAAGTIVPLDLT